jgi:hypothetical protein
VVLAVLVRPRRVLIFGQDLPLASRAPEKAWWSVAELQLFAALAPSAFSRQQAFSVPS